MRESTIRWVGASKIWTPPQSQSPRFALPLVEEEVLPVAFDKEHSNQIRLTKTCALNCTSRLAQRVALSQTNLNPRWSPLPWSPGVIKAPASCNNNGVCFNGVSEHVWLLSQYAPELANFGVMEERLFGEAFELDGARCDDRTTFFHPLRQHWNDTFNKILAYERVEAPEGIYSAAMQAVNAVGINNCCFCIEFRRTENGWKVIEIHARLGEDLGLPEKIYDTDPLLAVEKMFAKKS
jgi:hypothetical protein